MHDEADGGAYAVGEQDASAALAVREHAAIGQPEGERYDGDSEDGEGSAPVPSDRGDRLTPGEPGAAVTLTPVAAWVTPEQLADYVAGARSVLVIDRSIMV